MNKAELVEALAEHFDGNKAEANRALNAVLQTIIFKTTTEGRVAILGFGTFEKALRPARVVQDPSTGKKLRIKALATPTFRAGAEFKAYVAGVKKVPRRRRKPSIRAAAQPEPDISAADDSTRARRQRRSTAPNLSNDEKASSRSANSSPRRLTAARTKPSPLPPEPLPHEDA